MAEAEDRNKVGISIQALLFNIVCAGLNDPRPHFFEYPDVFFFLGPLDRTKIGIAASKIEQN